MESLGPGITLATKVHLVKAMVFPVVMYVCESWTIKKAESQITDAETEAPILWPPDCEEPIHWRRHW